MKIDNLGFNKEFVEYIGDVKIVYENLREKAEGGQLGFSFEEWIDENLKSQKEMKMINDFTDKEKFLFAFATLQGIIFAREGY